MIKKLFTLSVVYITYISWVFAAEVAWSPVPGPDVNCAGLPGCTDSTISSDAGLGFVSGVVSTLIQYVAVVAVIALMLSWIMYLFSGWEEEKINKAKKWIIWALVWVFLSISALWIIQLVNTLQISAT